MDDPGIHPIYDAVGRAVQAAASLEMWLAVAVNPLAAKSFERASKLDIKDQTRLILRHTAALPAGDVERLHQMLEEAERLVEFRNGVVHGWWYDHEPNGALVETLRGDRRQDPPLVTHLVVSEPDLRRTQSNRRTLLIFAAE